MCILQFDPLLFSILVVIMTSMHLVLVMCICFDHTARLSIHVIH